MGICRRGEDVEYSMALVSDTVLLSWPTDLSLKEGRFTGRG